MAKKLYFYTTYDDYNCIYKLGLVWTYEGTHGEGIYLSEMSPKFGRMAVFEHLHSGRRDMYLRTEVCLETSTKVCLETSTEVCLETSTEVIVSRVTMNSGHGVWLCKSQLPFAAFEVGYFPAGNTWKKTPLRGQIQLEHYILSNTKSPVAQLKELLDRQGLISDFKIVRSWDTFNCTASYRNNTAQGSGRSKKSAKNEAAKVLIRQLLCEKPDICLQIQKQQTSENIKCNPPKKNDATDEIFNWLLKCNTIRSYENEKENNSNVASDINVATKTQEKNKNESKYIPNKEDGTNTSILAQEKKIKNLKDMFQDIHYEQCIPVPTKKPVITDSKENMFRLKLPLGESITRTNNLTDKTQISMVSRVENSLVMMNCQDTRKISTLSDIEGNTNDYQNSRKLSPIADFLASINNCPKSSELSPERDGLGNMSNHPESRKMSPVRDGVANMTNHPESSRISLVRDGMSIMTNQPESRRISLVGDGRANMTNHPESRWMSLVGDGLSIVTNQPVSRRISPVGDGLASMNNYPDSRKMSPIGDLLTITTNHPESILMSPVGDGLANMTNHPESRRMSLVGDVLSILTNHPESRSISPVGDGLASMNNHPDSRTMSPVGDLTITTNHPESILMSPVGDSLANLTNHPESRRMSPEGDGLAKMKNNQESNKLLSTNDGLTNIINHTEFRKLSPLERLLAPVSNCSDSRKLSSIVDVQTSMITYVESRKQFPVADVLARRINHVETKNISAIGNPLASGTNQLEVKMSSLENKLANMANSPESKKHSAVGTVCASGTSHLETRKLGFVGESLASVTNRPETRKLTATAANLPDTKEPSMETGISRSESPVVRCDADVANAVGELQNLCVARRWPHPRYREVCPPGAAQGTHSMDCELLDFLQRGTGFSKKRAKHQAALKILQTVRNLT